MTRKTSLILGFLFIFFSACSSIQSGSYVYYSGKESLAQFAKKYGVSVEDLKSVNNERKLVPGSWVFIPTEVGIIPKMYFQYQYADFFGGNGKFLWPVPSKQTISSNFGKRGGRNHDGIDIPAPIGTEIVASESGKVVYSGSGIKGYGNLTIIAHKDNFFSVYAHADKNYKSKGDKVTRGEVIALVGNTGRSTGPHLHFEIRKKSTPLNPVAFFSKHKTRVLASK